MVNSSCQGSAGQAVDATTCLYWRCLSGQIEPVCIHDLYPGTHKILYEFLGRIMAGVNFSQGPQLRIRAKDKVDAAGSPF